MSTISFHTDITTSISHNNRINIYGNKDINLDKLKENIYYIQKDIKDLYRDEFGDAVNEYNSKQKRTDRKINNYYKKILNDKKTQHQRELIIAIGSKDENISDEIINKKFASLISPTIYPCYRYGYIRCSKCHFLHLQNR